LTCVGSPLGEREKVTLGGCGPHSPLSAYPDIQNRRIIDRLLVNAAAPPPLESNSMLVLFSHVRIGGFACVAPEKLASLLSLREPLRAIPIVEPQEIYTIGLVSSRQEPIPPIFPWLAQVIDRRSL
jgi:DNA-binding transcriptional LysR family regulator